MRTVETYGTFEDTLVTSEPRAQDLARRLRSLIAAVLPEVVEVPWPSQRVTGYGIGSKKMTEHFCYIAAQRDHVNLGFNQGADLDDPGHLLQGSGKALKHVKIRRPELVERPELRQLLEAAIARRRSA
jgi:hypothetical protein